MKKFKRKEFSLEGKLRAEKRFRSVLIVCAVLWCAFCIYFLWDFSVEKMGIAILSSFGLAGISLPLYFYYYFPYWRAMRWLRSKSSDINEKNYYGRAFFSHQPFAIIPYSEIGWVYLEAVFFDDDDEPREYKLCIYCKDGKKFKSEKADQHSYDEVAMKVPGVVTGIGSESRKKYLRNNPVAKAKYMRRWMIGGGILSVISFTSFLSNIIFARDNSITNIMFSIPLFCVGVWLLYQARNSDK